MASSDELLTTAIFGLRRSSSVRPSAFHCARRTASRGEPGSKLLRRAFFISANLSHNMDAVTSHQSPVASQEPPALLSKTWYWYYVLALLTICYIDNVVD